ncbi:hypothetical protein KC19_5G085100 [Ceratodon purpureus]|uniref:Uncharacterized protein n=1 Tax=Ceratodon purpureus TaxID=3225 RepID=A0A8T0I0F9_CERPU|nr:hypothetical protein KC19_5G085100 [Ceratodon purpureus]
MGRAPCCDERVALKKGPWTPDEDQKLVAYIQKHGHGSWRHLPEKAGLARCGKSCRLRWTNYLRPDIKRGRFTNEEDQIIIQLHAILGNRWSAIASHLPRRTDNEIKNYWNTHLKKRLSQMGIDPVTHKTSSAGLALAPAWTPLVSTQLTHNTQWHSALAEAEARLSQLSAPPSLLSELQGSATTVPHPSAYFMRSWKTKVEDTLRPAFGTVKLEPHRERLNIDYSTPAPTPNITRLQKPLQDWNTALGIQTTASPFLEKYAAMAMKDIGFPSQTTNSVFQSKPDLLSDMFKEISERPGNHPVFGFVTDDQLGVGLENHFSPTSILQGPDSDSCSGSGDNSDCNFEFLHHDAPGSSYHSFPLIDGEYAAEHAQTSASMSVDIPESFWQAEQHAVSLLEDLKNMDASEGGGLEMIVPLSFDVVSNGGGFDPSQF